MSSIPSVVAERLATLSRQAKVSSLSREASSFAFTVKGMTPREVEETEYRFARAKQATMTLLEAAIDNCDLVNAETQLQTMLSLSARLKGCQQAKEVSSLPL